MIKFEFPADRTDIATAIGKALLEIGNTTRERTETVGDVSLTEKVTVATQASEDAPELIGVQAHLAPVDPKDAPTSTGDAVGDDVKLDHNGVAFDAAFCGNAQKPFYSSGKQQGQWKKRQGVDQIEYDSWYAAELAKVPKGEAGADAQVDTAAAFGGQETDADPDAPTDLGSFMLWATGHQTAGNLTQQDVTAAWAEAGLTVADLMPLTPPAQIAQNTCAVYDILKLKADA